MAFLFVDDDRAWFLQASNFLARLIFAGISRPLTHLATQSQSRQAEADRDEGISW